MKHADGLPTHAVPTPPPQVPSATESKAVKSVPRCGELRLQACARSLHRRPHSVAAGRLTSASACPPPSCHLVSPVLPAHSSIAQPSRAPDYQAATTLGQGQQRGLCLAVFMSEEGKEPPKEATLPHRARTSPLGAVGSTGTFSRSCEVSPASHHLWGSVRTRLLSPGAGSASRLAPRGPCQGADGQRREGRD